MGDEEISAIATASLTATPDSSQPPPPPSLRFKSEEDSVSRPRSGSGFHFYDEKQEHDEDHVPGDDTGSGVAPPKKKQKRNKPTLSCEECVERKTKVRRFLSFSILSFSSLQSRLVV